MDTRTVEGVDASMFVGAEVIAGLLRFVAASRVGSTRTHEVVVDATSFSADVGAVVNRLSNSAFIAIAANTLAAYEYTLDLRVREDGIA